MLKIKIILTILLLTLVSCKKSNKIKYPNANRDLFIAANIENVKIAKKALSHGADVNHINKNKLTPILAAANNESLRTGVTRLLIENGANLEAKDQLGRTALYIAFLENKFDLVKLLIDKGANINVVDTKGIPILHTAIRKNNIEMIKILLEKGADIKVKDAGGTTPLIVATFNGSYKIAKLLIENNADINGQSDDGWTALHVASTSSMYRITKLLLKHKANLFIEDKRGNTPIKYASGYLKNLLEEQMEKESKKKTSK